MDILTLVHKWRNETFFGEKEINSSYRRHGASSLRHARDWLLSSVKLLSIKVLLQMRRMLILVNGEGKNNLSLL